MWPLHVCTWTRGSHLMSRGCPGVRRRQTWLVFLEQNEARLSRAVSDALSTHWKRGQGKARPALGIPGQWAHVTWPRTRGCTRDVSDGVMWTNSGVQGEIPGAEQSGGFASDQKGAVRADSHPDLIPDPGRSMPRPSPPRKGDPRQACTGCLALPHTLRKRQGTGPAFASPLCPPWTKSLTPTTAP